MGMVVLALTCQLLVGPDGTDPGPVGKRRAMFESLKAADRLEPAHWTMLKEAGWAERVAGRTAIWISIDEQRLRIIEGETVVFEAPCATAAEGVGSEMDSLKTPRGWHSIAKKIGGNAPWGQVFRARRPTGEVWRASGDTQEDLVLTRIIVLGGAEPGKNKGGSVDSEARHIYIHGTNDEARIGTPSSHGCIRLTNDDIIVCYGKVDEGSPVLITARNGG